MENVVLLPFYIPTLKIRWKWFVKSFAIPFRYVHRFLTQITSMAIQQ